MQKEGSKNFDDIMKNKLKGLSVDASPSDWIMMERMLEWEGLTQEGDVTDETTFDEIAHDKLNNVPTNGLVPDWNRMSSLLDEMNEEPSIEPSEFDQAIDNRIKHTAVGIDMAVWDRMEPILDADRAVVVSDLDAVAKDKLTQISDIQPAWNSMDAKINRELFLPESIVKYKVLEIAMILLFAFSLSQFPLEEVADRISEHNIATSTQKSRIPIVEEEKTITTIAPAKVDNSEVITSVSEEVIPSGTEIITTIETKSVASLPTEEVETTSPKTAADQSNFAWQFPPTFTQLIEELRAKPSFSISENVFSQVLSPVDLPRYTGFSSPFELSDIFSGNEIGVDAMNTNNSSLAFAHIDEPRIEAISHPTARPSVDDEDIAVKQRKVGLILGMFTGSDYNEIVTPFDPLLAREGSTQWNVGYGGGISLGMRFKNWELETGAVYASNQYQPSEIYEIYSGSITSGYSVFTLSDIELDIVKVPLNFRFNVNLWEKWKVYALSGATMNMVIQSEFKTDDVFLGPSSITTQSTSSSSAISQKDFREGILEGGSFNDNSFFTANLGFGVERTLNNNWSVFAQPTYQRQIFSSGIGPNQDRYNSVSLLLGTRVALSSKARIKGKN